MKYKKSLLLSIFAFLIVGIFMISHARFKNEVEKENQDIRNIGQSLVKMVGLAYGRNFETLDNSFFFRELTHLVSNREIDYFVIQSQKQDKPIISFFLEDIQKEIPKSVGLKAMVVTGYQIQEFTLADGSPYLEFTKPVFKNGIPEVGVRLGKALVSRTFFTMENLILPLQVIFFILLASMCGYYWFYLLLNPFEKFIPANEGVATPGPHQANVQTIARELETFFNRTREQISSAEQETQKLTAKIQVLTYENNQMFHIFNHLDFGILMVDIKDMVFFINDYFLTLLDMDRKEIMNHSFFDAPGHEALKSFVQQQTLMDQGLDMARLEVGFPAFHPDQHFLASVQSLTGPDEILFGRLVKVVNITREKKAEKSQQDFTNHIAHELRTPLTNIKAYNEMMMEGEITNLEMQKEFFNTINDETNRLDQLIQSIWGVS
jgi:signal transduction histidine kinase